MPIAHTTNTAILGNTDNHPPLPVLEIGPTGLTLNAHTDPDAPTTITIHGELDITSARQFTSYVNRVSDHPTQSGKTIIIDLTHLTFCDGRGMGALIRAANHAAATDTHFILTEPARHVLKALRIGRLHDRFTFIRRPDAAAPVLSVP